MLQFNDKKYALDHSFAFKMKIPDMEAMTPADFQKGPGGMKWIVAQAVALSDKPFDGPALSKLPDPTEALDLMAQKGAAVVTAVAGKGHKVSLLRVALPDGKILQPDAVDATLSLQAGKDGKISGKLLLKGDRKMHEFDPQNVPLIEINADFAAPSP
jgi:hypothetical protein